MDLASPSSTLTCRGLHWPNVPETGGQGAWSMSIWTSPGGTARAGGAGMGGAMAPCRLLSHWDPHSAWWPTQPTELGAQPSNASSPVQSMVLWSQRAPRLAGATCDQGHHPSAARPQITSPGRRQARRGAGSVQLERGHRCGLAPPSQTMVTRRAPHSVLWEPLPGRHCCTSVWHKEGLRGI